MSLWEYKVITSGKGGFASPVLLEKFLNDLGRDEWEIVEFRTSPDNTLAFSGLARRTTQRDWTLQDAAAAAAKTEAEKLRAEFEAKFKAATNTGGPVGGEERSPSFLEEKAAPEDGFRKPVDTSRDDDPEAEDEPKDDWDKLTAAEQDELPTFFDAIKPHLRRNQRGAGMSVGVDYLAKKWDQAEEDLKGALAECGFVIPNDEDSEVDYLEYDGDLYWLNINRRGELWINTKEKPRPLFRVVKAPRAVVEEETKPEAAKRPEPENRSRPEREKEREARPAEPSAPVEKTAEEPSTPRPANAPARQPAGQLPKGPGLLDRIRPHMRRNRRGPGGSGSTTFLARALRCSEADLMAAFGSLNLPVPTSPADKPVFVEINDELWWLNQDSRGGFWINGREKLAGETAADATAAEAAAPAAEQSSETGTPAATPSPASESSSAETTSASGEAPAPEDADAATSAPPAESTSSASSAAEPTTAPEATPSSLLTRMETAPLPLPSAETSSPRAAESSAPESTATRESTSVSESALEAAPKDLDASPPSLAKLRSLLKETRTGALASRVDRLAEALGQAPDNLVATLLAAGLKVPEKSREKPFSVEHAGETYWLSKNAKDEIWLNAKASKSADRKEPAEGEDAVSQEGETGADADDRKPPRRSSRPKKKAD